MVFVMIGVPFILLVTTGIASVMQVKVVLMEIPLVADANPVISVDDGVPREVQAEVGTRLIHHLCVRKSNIFIEYFSLPCDTWRP